MSKKLRGCPFCGSDDVNLWSGNWEGYAVCLDCGAEGPKVEVSDVHNRSKDEMAMKLWWNKRTADDVMLDAADEIEGSKEPCLQWLVRLLREEAGR